MIKYSPAFYASLEGFKEQHDTLVDIITKAVSCDTIFLLGNSISHTRTETLFTTQSATCKYVSRYYLLVIIPKTDKEPNMQVQDKIEGNLQHFIPSTVIVLDTEQFNSWIKEAHPVSAIISKRAYLLYGQETPEMIQTVELSEEQFKARAQSIYTQGLNKIQEFLAGADLFRIREQNKMAAFMLHQALEQALRNLMLIVTGLNINTHSLDRLIRFCSMFAYKLPGIFPSNNEKNEKLFQLLQKAYIDSRYKEDYYISTDDLLLLTNRIRAVQEVYQQTLKELVFST